ncbi:MAG: Fe-S cluster assembly protein NifU [Deltaproteobacteria bacterium]|jgi:NifU-like protein|nr:Fe-S cluster assembly protein NifU [Deltaproteobacteria bacterium]MCK5422854.1 Fe-S cluster assembly protein NifU [Deltaproteobacteria bacterium]
MWDYSEKVKDHFFNPRNVGEIKNPDGVGEVGSLACGDALKFMFKLDENKRIKEAKFKTFGCGSAIASASVLTEIVIGKTLEEADKITNKDLANYLDGLPQEKMHCSVMGREALEAAIADYRGIDIKKQLEGEVTCKCFGITDKEIERVIKENQLSTVAEVTHYTKAGGGCESCHPKIEEIISKVEGKVSKKPAPEKIPQKQKLTNIQKMKLIEETIEREIRPALRTDGGDIDLVDIEGNKVIVTLRGTCSSCPSSNFTLKGLVEGKLREFVSNDIEVMVET